MRQGQILNHVVKVVLVSGDKIEVYFDGLLLGSANRASHGQQGIDLVLKMMRELARRMGWFYVEEE